MLQKLNERIQGLVAWLVILLIAVTFTLFGVDYYIQSHQTSNTKISVNNQPITNQEFELSYRRTRSQQEATAMSLEEEKNLQHQVLNQMITNLVTIQAAHRYGFEVSADQANAAILMIPQFQEEGRFSAQKYQQALNGALFTPETFQSEVRQGMLLNQQRFVFIGSSFALPGELERFVRLYMQTRNYDYLIIPAAAFEKGIKISEDKIKEYYYAHLKQFMTPEQVSVDYVILSMPEIVSKINISKKDIKQYYEENQNNFMTPAQWKVAHILFAVPEQSSKEEVDKIQERANKVRSTLQQKPEQFDQLVASMSDDKLSLAEKGVLPWITAGQNEYSSLLSNLTKTGQISEPVKTKQGFELFKLIAYKPASTKSLPEVETVIKNQLLSDKTQSQYTQALEQLADLSYQTPDSLDAVSKALKLNIQHSELFSRAGGTTPMTKNQQLINSAFSHDVLNLGNNSEPIQLNNESVVVLRLNTHKPAKEQALSLVHDQIEKLLTKKYAQLKAKEVGLSLLNQGEDKKQQDWIQSNNLKWQSRTNASRDNDNSNTSITDVAFNLAKPNSRDGLTLENGDYVVVKLNQINDGQFDSLDQEHKNSLEKQIETSYGMMDYDLYVNNLITQAKIIKH